MGRPPQNTPRTPQRSAPFNPVNAPVIIPSPAPMPDEEKIAAGIDNMTLYPQDAPALQDAIAKARHEAHEEGKPLSFALEQFDLAALPGTTAGEELGAGDVAQESAERLAVSMEQFQAEQAHAAAVKKAYEEGRARAAAEAGVPVDGLFDNALTRKRLMGEKRYVVMVAPLPSDPLGARYVCGSINCVEYEVPIGTPTSLPYSIVSAMVEQGRCAPPIGCEELMVQAIHAAASQGRSIVAPAAHTRNQPGSYFGETARGADAMMLDNQFAAQVRAQVAQTQGLAVPPPSSSQAMRF